MKPLIEIFSNEFLRTVFQKPLTGSVVYLRINGEIYKIEKSREGITLSVPSEKDIPLLILEATKSAINLIASEQDPKRIRRMIKDLYSRGDIKVKIAAPTSILVSRGVASMLRSIGLVFDKKIEVS